MSSPEGEKVVCAKYMFELVLKDSSLFLPEAGGGGGGGWQKGSLVRFT